MATNRELKDAIDITPDLTTKWCVLVQVLVRRKPKKKEDGPLFRNYVVADTKGTMVPIVMFDESVAKFAHTLEPYKRYYVSNAHVKLTPTQYKSLEYPYTWTLQRRNLVEPYQEAIPPPLSVAFQLNNFADLYRYADHENLICIKALIVHTLPVQENGTSTFKDCIVINQEMIPMIIRVWDDVDLDTDVNVYTKYKCPTMIIAYGLQATTQHGLSLKTRPQAYFMEEPPLIEDKPLKEWYDAHSIKITRLIETQAYRDVDVLFHPPRPAEILPLTFAIATIQNVKATWTEGTIHSIPGQQHVWFEVCEKCLTELNVDKSWKIFCSYCKEWRQVALRYSVGVLLTHGRTTIEATIKSPEIEKLVPFTADEMRIAAAENKPLTTQLEEALENKHVICFLKYYDRQSKGTMRRRYPVLKIYTEVEMASYNTPHQAAALPAMPYELTTGLKDVGSSSSAPKTPATKEVCTSTTETVIKDNTQPQPSTEHQQLEQKKAKRSLTFEEPDDRQPVSITNKEIAAAASAQPATNMAVEKPTDDPTNSGPMKKLKPSDKEA